MSSYVRDPIRRQRDAFSAQLRLIRESAAISLRRLAERTPGIPYSRLSLLERGLEPRAGEVRVIANAIGKAIAEKLGGDR